MSVCKSQLLSKTVRSQLGKLLIFRLDVNSTIKNKPNDRSDKDVHDFYFHFCSGRIRSSHFVLTNTTARGISKFVPSTFLVKMISSYDIALS